MTIASADVKDALRPEQVLDRYGIKARRSGSELRFSDCPSCGRRSRRDTVAMSAVTGRWLDHAHGCSGDLITMVALLEGIDPERDFPKALAAAAQVAGVVATDPIEAEIRRRRAFALRRERAAAELAEIERKRVESIAEATLRWEALSASIDDDAAERLAAYLEQRGVAGVGDDVLPDEQGRPCVRLRSVDGNVVNVMRRRDGEPRFLGLTGCPTLGTYVGWVGQIVGGTDAILCEGMFDSLTARLAWPGAAIIGAVSASTIPKIAAAAALRCRAANARLLLCPHRDRAGWQAMLDAGSIALSAGLSYGTQLVVVNSGAKDLNEAWCQGWRP